MRTRAAPLPPPPRRLLRAPVCRNRIFIAAAEASDQQKEKMMSFDEKNQLRAEEIEAIAKA